MHVKPKKSLGQHFLRDENIARKVAASLSGFGDYKQILEVGPGTGVLTRHLLQGDKWQWRGIEIDRDSVAYLQMAYPELNDRLTEADFLKIPLQDIAKGEPFALIGNFPYNISSQILFKVLENRDMIPEVVGMFQKEVAQRVVAPPGNKTYGILSVLVQAFYEVKLLFAVPPQVFDPPPKVDSAVIRMKRIRTSLPECDEKRFFYLVKKAFNQRRKTLRNALKGTEIAWDILPEGMSQKRAEQLGVEDFIDICRAIPSRIV